MSRKVMGRGEEPVVAYNLVVAIQHKTTRPSGRPEGPNVNTSTLRQWCLGLSSLAIAAGVLGMPMSFLYLASADARDISAGTSGFVAGAVLIGSGLISLAILSLQNLREEPNQTNRGETTRLPGDDRRITRDRPSLP